MKPSVFHQVTGWVIAAAFLIAAVFQAQITYRDYARTWLARIRNNLTLPAYERSAVFYLKPKGAAFLRFIESAVPADATLILIPNMGRFSEQSVMQSFLLSRSIVKLNPDDGCEAFARYPDAYVLAPQDFACQDGELAGLWTFRAYPQQEAAYPGIFVPGKALAALNGPAAADHSRFYPFPAVLMDVGILAFFGLMGILILLLIHPRLEYGWLAALAIPAGTGLFTWLCFLLGWAGLGFNLRLAAGLALAVTGGLLFWHIRKRTWKSLASFPGSHADKTGSSRGSAEGGQLRAPLAVFRSTRLLHHVGLAGMAALVCACLVVVAAISIGRGYSTFDDIAIWSLKGYGIAEQQTLFSTAKTGGHGLAYPLNLSLAIGTFYLANGDVVPGSKLVFVGFVFSLLAGFWQFFRSRNVSPYLILTGFLFFLTVPQVMWYATFGFANFPFTVTLVLATFLGIDALRRPNKETVLLCSLMFGLAGWTRPEGILFGGALILVLFLFQRRGAEAPAVALPAWLAGLIIPAAWLAFAFPHIREDQAGSALREMSTQIQAGGLFALPFEKISAFAFERIQSPVFWGFLFPTAAAALLVILPWLPKRNWRETGAMFAAWLTAGLVPFLLFAVESFDEPDFQTFLDVSWDRAYLPFAFLLISLVLLAAQPGIVKPHGEKDISSGKVPSL